MTAMFHRQRAVNSLYWWRVRTPLGGSSVYSPKNGTHPLVDEQTCYLIDDRFSK